MPVTHNDTIKHCCTEWLIVVSDSLRKCPICGKVFIVDKDGKIKD